MKLKQAEEKIAEYLKEIDKNDTAYSTEDERVDVDELKESETTEYPVVLIFS